MHQAWPGPPPPVPAPCLQMVVAVRARVFITMLYTSLVPSYSSLGACHFDVVSASRPASGLHMDGQASGPIPALCPLCHFSRALHGPNAFQFLDSGLGLCLQRGWGFRAWRQLLGRGRKPWHSASSRGRITSQCSTGLQQKAASWQKALL